MSAVLSAQGLGKRYRGGSGAWSLRGVDLHVDAGEVVAVIGRNGAGKSTFLKIAAGVTRQTEGTLSRVNRVAPLIEVGAGFHPELSGRDNVGVNGRLLGMSSQQIKRKFDDIVEFADLAHVIDRPVKEYSSGMYMRLGFAVAVHTAPELLLVDEVLAVGDLPFQVKCLDRIRALRSEGAGVLFVSHNLAAVLSLANRALLLEGGQPRAEGDPAQVVGAYHALLAAEGQPIDAGNEEAGVPGDAEVVELSVLDVAGNERDLWYPGERVVIEMRLRARVDIPESMIGLRLHREGAGVVGGWMGTEGLSIAPMRAGDECAVRAEMSLNVAEGGYLLDVAHGRRDCQGQITSMNHAYRFGVASRPGGSGIVDLDARMTAAEPAVAPAGEMVPWPR